MHVSKNGNSFASNLNLLMDERDMGLTELSRSSGVSKAMIGYLKNGDRFPTSLTIQKLAKALRVEPWVMMLPTGAIRTFIEDSPITSEILKALASVDRPARESVLRVAQNEARLVGDRPES